jgi:hypothetical protein
VGNQVDGTTNPLSANATEDAMGHDAETVNEGYDAENG